MTAPAPALTPASWRWAGSAALAGLMLAMPAAALPLELPARVEGAVRRPGPYLLPPGARVAELLRAAGGPLPGAQLAGLPLSARVEPGTRLRVPLASQSPAGWWGRPWPQASARPRPRLVRRARSAAPRPPLQGICLNRASAAELDRLPGVGPAMAQRILAARVQAGGFRALEDLREVRGLGAKRLAKMAPYLRLN